MSAVHTPIILTSRYMVQCFDRLGRLKWQEVFKNRVVTEGLNTVLNRSFDTVASDVNWYIGLIGPSTGTVSITSAAAAVTGSGTSFANGDSGSRMIIVGAGAAGVDLVTSVSGNPASTTALTTAGNAGTTVVGVQYALEPRPTDVMNSKSFVEITPYSDATRPAWTKNSAAAAGAMSNSSSKAVFNINASHRIFGLFMVSNNTKGGTTGILYGGNLFTTLSRAVVDTDVLNAQVDISAAAA